MVKNYWSTYYMPGKKKTFALLECDTKGASVINLTYVNRKKLNCLIDINPTYSKFLQYDNFFQDSQEQPQGPYFIG